MLTLQLIEATMKPDRMPSVKNQQGTRESGNFTVAKNRHHYALYLHSRLYVTFARTAKDLYLLSSEVPDGEPDSLHLALPWGTLVKASRLRKALRKERKVLFDEGEYLQEHIKCNR